MSRRLVAARYRAADSLRAAWRSNHTRPLLVAAGLALGAALLGEASGLSRVIDGEIRALVDPLDGSTVDVGAIVVSLDTPADLAARDRLTARLRDGAARAVVVVPALGDAPRALGLRADGGRFERLTCDGVLADGLAAIGAPCEEDALVRFAPPSDATTVLPARAILDGDVPAGAFAGAIVVVGDIAGPARLPTPRGELSPPDAVAQILGSIAVGRRALEARGLALAILVALAIAGTLVAVRTPARRGVRTLLVTVAATVGSIALAIGAGVVIGPTTLVVGVLAAALALVALEARDVAARLGGVVVRLEGVGARGIDRGRYAAIARLAASQLGAKGSLVLELPEGLWHVRLVGADGYGEPDLVEVRRDVRRPPFTEALRAGHVVTPRFLAQTPTTVLVPLVAEGLTLGFWAIGFYEATVDVGAVTRLAADVAAGLLHAEAEVAAESETRGFVALPDRLAHLDAASAGLASRVQRDARMFETLPVPVLVAGPWGTVEVANFAMRELLAGLGVDPAERGLVRILAYAADLDERDAFALVRRAMAGGAVPLPVTEEGPGSKLELVWAPGIAGAPGTFTLTATNLDDEATAARDDAFSRAEPSVSGPYLRILEERASEPGRRSWPAISRSRPPSAPSLPPPDLGSPSRPPGRGGAGDGALSPSIGHAGSPSMPPGMGPMGASRPAAFPPAPSPSTRPTGERSV